MSEKRRDNKGRVLRTGEGQRSNGQYYYKYTDASKKAKFIYNWRLENHDKVPQGKRKKALTLREEEKQIQRALLDELVPNGGNMTVLALVQKYVLQKTGVRESTRAGYKTVINLLKKDPFGARRIGSVKVSDAKEWLIQLQKNGKSFSSVCSIRGVVNPAFRMAYNDDLIRKNPFDFELKNVLINDSIRREAISREQERKFLTFIKQDSHYSKYYDAIYILFHTGLRISEFVGLTLDDINLKEKTIRVNHQLQRVNRMEYTIVSPKTNAGIRTLPMSDDVRECFQRIIQNRNPPKVEPMIQGKGGFLFFDKNGRPLVALHWDKYFQRICKKYNSIYKEELPQITPHVCRHTYCTKMARNGVSPKTLQYLMGHSDISTTLGIYTHFGFDDAAAEVKRVAKATAT